MFSDPLPSDLTLNRQLRNDIYGYSDPLNYNSVTFVFIQPDGKKISLKFQRHRVMAAMFLKRTDGNYIKTI
jgi:hypothetical protein